MLPERPERALALGAHTKDVDIEAGGLLARWSAEGTEVTLAVVTDSSRGTSRVGQGRQELSRLRAEEQQRAAVILGYRDIRFLDLPDGELCSSERWRRPLAALIRSVRPQVVLTYDPWRPYELIADHRNIGLLVGDAIVAARDPLFFPELLAAGFEPWRPDCLLLFAPAEPDAEADVTDFLERKLDAVLAHRSHSVKRRLVGELDEAGLGELRDLVRDDHRTGDGRAVERFRAWRL
ncbi:MAG TPA: PIG-L deacetylase family protein [Candidatus Eisenbacteria bacterium]|nr:PIG-L deacetylase family protein [Candidatus Eisenbacteria bacterium]